MKQSIYIFILVILLNNNSLLGDHEIVRPQSCPIAIFSHGTAAIFNPINNDAPQTEGQTRLNIFIRRPQPRNRQADATAHRQQARENILQAARERTTQERQENEIQAAEQTDQEIRSIILSTQDLTVSDDVDSQASTATP